MNDIYVLKVASLIQKLRMHNCLLKPHMCSHPAFIFAVTDRLSTGIALADIDFSFIDSVRTKMPIDKVHIPEFQFVLVLLCLR